MASSTDTITVPHPISAGPEELRSFSRCCVAGAYFSARTRGQRRDEAHLRSRDGLCMATIASQPWTRMKVSKAMHSGVVTVSPTEPLTKVAKLMADRRLHCVVVATAPIEVGSLWGTITDLDLMAAASVRSVEDQCAAGSTSTPAVLISPQARLTDAAELMTRHGVTHLVVAEATRPVGVLSTLDVAVAIADSAPASSRSENEARR